MISQNHQDWIESKEKLFVSGGVGAATGVVTRVVVKGILEKAVSKGTLRMSANIVRKIGRLGGKLLKSTVGPAAVGSSVPGLGTGLGVFAGGIGFLFTEKIMVEIDERITREDFKKDFLLAIQEAKVELKRGILNNNLQPE